MNLVSMRNVSVSYDGYEALRNVNLDIADDDFIGIIGPNGGGKTTLVKAILGTVPYRGTITLAPELFHGKERLIGYMPQLSNFDRSFPISVIETTLSGLQGRRGFRSRGYRRSGQPSDWRNLGRTDAAGAALPGHHLRPEAADTRRAGQLRRQQVRKGALPHAP